MNRSDFYGGGLNSRSGVPYWNTPLQDEYKALLAVVSQKPSKAVQNAQNTWFYNAKTKGYYSKMACVLGYAFGMPVAADSLFWLNNPARKATLSAHAPDYTVNNGWTGDVANSAYIDTTFNPSVDGGLLYTQNDAAIFKYFINRRTSTSTATAGITTINPKGGIAPLYSANTGYFSINGAWQTFTSTDTNHAYCAVRKNATQMRLYIDRTEGSLVSNNSIALPNCTSYDLAANTGAGAADAPSYMPDTIALSIYASGLSATDITNICDDLDELIFSLQSKVVTMYDSCDGTTIDLAKWAITNPNIDVATFRQNNALIMDSLIAGTSPYNNYIKSIASIPFGVLRLSVLDLEYLQTQASRTIGLVDSANAFRIGLMRISTDVDTSKLSYKIYLGAGLIYDFITDIEDTAIIKYVVTPTHKISCYHWVNDAWVQVGADFTYLFGSLYAAMLTRGYDSTITSIRDVYMTKYNYNTLIP